MPGIHAICLVVEKEGAVHRARWIDEAGQESEPFDLELPLTAEDAAQLRWYLEKYRGFVGAGTRVQARAAERRIAALGEELFAASFGGPESGQVYRNLQGKETQLTISSNDSSVLQQPWELMRDSSGPLAFKGVAIRRQLIGAKALASGSRRFQLPLRLLLIVARPNGTSFIDPRSSMGPLLDVLDLLPEGTIELYFCEPPTLGRLEELLTVARREERPFHVVHFDGHGQFLSKKGRGYLCFERADRHLDFVTGRRLGKILARLEIPLILLEACRTSDLSNAPVFGSLAPALLESGVGSVVAFSHAISVTASRILVESFYRALASGRSIGQALSQARQALREKPQRPLHLGPKAASVDLEDWFVPQLYQASADPALLSRNRLNASGTAASKPRPETKVEGFPPTPIYRFHGRARDLLELERAFERHPAVLVTGGGGMGKTALAREAAWWWLRKGRIERAVFVSFERPTVVERVVQELGQAFEGLSFSSRPVEEQRKTALGFFRERKVLLAWDNFESTLPQFQQGEEGGPMAYPDEERSRLRLFCEELAGEKGEGRLLVTCRPAEAFLPGIQQCALAGLERSDSLHLLHAIADLRGIDLERDGFEQEEIEKLLDLLDDHPLSLSLVGPHLKDFTPAAIRANFAELLECFTDEPAAEGRNRSLAASLAFSTSRLSPEAKAILPWLAFFQGGTFEINVLRLTGLGPETWLAIRAEMEGTALLRAEEVAGLNVPFLRFHPTLPFSARCQEVGDLEAAEERFLEVYLAVGQEVDAALRGSKAATGMTLLELEEANYRSAIEIAIRRGENRFGGYLADTLGLYLERADRPRERDALVDWIGARLGVAGGNLGHIAWAATSRQALALAGRGRADEAQAMLRQLIARLEAIGLADSEDVAFEVGTSYGALGEILVQARRPDRAVEASQKAVAILELLPGEEAQGNLCAALGNLAHARRMLGRLPEALAAAQRALGINRRLGRERNAAASIGQCAQILASQQRWAEAEAHYQEAFTLARGLGELALQGTFLQHQGGLHLDLGNSARAADLFSRAVSIFQQASSEADEMQTCDLLASAERQRGELDAAEAWYTRARQLAVGLGDRQQLAITAQNVGILYQVRAEREANAESRKVWLERALASIEESLEIDLEMNHEVGAAASFFQLGVVHRQTGDLDTAERKLRQSLEIYQRLDHPEMWKSYANLAQVATARGEIAAAADWAARRDAKLAELKQLRGESAAGYGLSRLTEPLLALVREIYLAQESRSGLDSKAAKAIVTLCSKAPPLGEIGAFLRAVAAGDPLPAVPAGLPPLLAQVLDGLAEAVAGIPE